MVTEQEKELLVTLSHLLGQCAMFTHHLHSGEVGDQQEIELVNALSDSLGDALVAVDELVDAREGTPIMVAVPSCSDSEE